MSKELLVDAMLVGKGKRALITAEIFIGNYAVHKRITDSQAIGDGYSVTHRPSGAAIWTVATREEADRVATWLAEDKIIPEGAVEIMQWIAAMTVLARSQLVARLENIAPRYRTPWSATAT